MTATSASWSTRERSAFPWWLLVDPLLVLSTAAIGVMGALLVYSATRGPATVLEPANTAFLERQVVFLVGGSGLAVAAALFDIRRLRRLVPVGYAGLVFLLLAVLLLGTEVNGAKAWFQFAGFQLQPSEPGKIVLIVALASLFSTEADPSSPRRLAAGLALAGVPIAIILLQPDLGTVLVYLAIVVVVIVVSGVRARVIGLLALLALSGGVVIFQSDVLEGYQEARLTVFLLDDAAIGELDSSIREVAYNAEQAQVAIGNGGFRGQGLFNGTQTRSNLVPEQQTDFIFTVAGEELGFRGAALLLVLYAVLLARILRAAQNAASVFGRLVCVGVFAMFLFQVFQSVGMTMGMMPVTGIPLPLVSYGGSSMMTSMIAIGLVAGVHRRRFLVDEMR